MAVHRSVASAKGIPERTAQTTTRMLDTRSSPRSPMQPPSKRPRTTPGKKDSGAERKTNGLTKNGDGGARGSLHVRNKPSKLTRRAPPASAVRNRPERCSRARSQQRLGRVRHLQPRVLQRLRARASVTRNRKPPRHSHDPQRMLERWNALTGCAPLCDALRTAPTCMAVGRCRGSTCSRCAMKLSSPSSASGTRCRRLVRLGESSS